MMASELIEGTAQLIGSLNLGQVSEIMQSKILMAAQVLENIIFWQCACFFLLLCFAFQGTKSVSHDVCLGKDSPISGDS